MNQPLFATYSTNENRVSASVMAVFERLSLGTLQRLLSDATEEEVTVVEFQTQPRNPFGPGTPDALISASALLLIEAKIKIDDIDVEQIERHRVWLDNSAADNARLYVLTPDLSAPRGMEQFVDDERIVWVSFTRLDDAIASALDLLPIDEVTERERFLLRELAAMLRQENLVGGFDTVIVAGRVSWPEYLEWGIYACQAQRTFRDVPYLGFYANRQIQPKIARRLAWWPRIPFDHDNARALAASDDPLEQRLGEAIPAILANTERNERYEYGVMMLSPPDDHATLEILPVPHHGKGAWTQSQRYTSSELLLAKPEDTAELSTWEQDRRLR